MMKAELLNAIRRDRAILDGLLARTDRAGMLEPALDGGWSVKDVLAHITAWEQLCLKWLKENKRQELTAGTDNDAKVNELNARLYAENKDRPLDEIVAEHARSHREISAATEALSEEALAAPPAWAPHTALSNIIDANSADHYREHIEQLTRWLGGARSD